MPGEQPYFKRYRADHSYCAADGGTVFVDVVDRATNTVRRTKELPLYLQVRNHSPTGFAWRYGGSGPAQLSLAILIDCLKDEERAVALYQKFKFARIAQLSQSEGFEMTSDEVMTFVDQLERHREVAHG